MARFAVAVPLILLLAFVASAQNPPQSDPRAVSLALQAMTALTNGIAVSDVTLNGSATWIAGSDNETGTVTLLAKGSGESRVDLSLAGGIRSEIRNDSARSRQGETISPDGTVSQHPEHNCWINASWFFPALSILAGTSDGSAIFTYVGFETFNGQSVQHLRVYRYVPNKRPGTVALIEALSTEDIYLDSSTLLPTAFIFNTHPDDDALTNILIEIDFSNYQPIAGRQIPTRAKRLLNGGLALDITVTGAVLNSGLPDSLFAIQ